MEVEAVLLTGGASRRMGADKSRLLVGGEQAAVRLARELAEAFGQVTVLGREPLEGHAFQQDASDYEGPLSALARLKPTADWIFVCSCDLPLASAGDFRKLWSLRQEGKALAPVLKGRLQPLCALYPASCFAIFRQSFLSGTRSLMAALKEFPVVEAPEAALHSAGIQPPALAGANTAEEWARLLDTPHQVP
ncbi:MAG: molybdenum cofactor guanylyltransferase [Armatimonadetes bacterium]|nr:molybdenum cofactor guanylyltransferase [Armatimonadota bacterium]